MNYLRVLLGIAFVTTLYSEPIRIQTPQGRLQVELNTRSSTDGRRVLTVTVKNTTLFVWDYITLEISANGQIVREEMNVLSLWENQTKKVEFSLDAPLPSETMWSIKYLEGKAVGPLEKRRTLIDRACNGEQVSIDEMRDAEVYNRTLFNAVLLQQGCGDTLSRVKKGTGNAQPAIDSKTRTLESPRAGSVDFEVLSVDYKITESNNMWSRFSWRLKVRNKSGVSRVFGGQIEFHDEDGFIVDVGPVAAEMIPGNGEQVFTGFVLISSQGAGKVAQCVGKIRPQR